MADVIRMGLVGLGMMGRNHARVLQSLEGVELVAVADAAGDKIGGARAVPSFPDVTALIAYGIDACVVASPTGTHRDVGVELAEAGVHTLIEKPLAADPVEATEVAEAF